MLPARPRLLLGLLPFPVLVGALVVAAGMPDWGFVAFLVGAELLAAFAAWSEKAFEAVSRADLLEAGRARGQEAQARRLLGALPTYLLSARVLRFLGKAALVVGLASWLLGDELASGTCEPGGLVPVPWSSLAGVLALAFGVNFVLNDVLVGVLARRSPERFLLGSARALDLLRWISAPIRLPLVGLVRLLFRVPLEPSDPGAREEVRETVTEGRREGTISTKEAEMIAGIIDLPRRTAGDVLIPRSQVSMLPADTTVADAVAFAREDGHSRVPVYGRDKDDVLGVLHVRDLLAHLEPGDADETRVRDLMRPPTFVPETKPLPALLEELRASKVHLAIVLNEIGATAGIVTVEDLLEEIVGEIHDEFDVDDRRLPRPEDLARGGVPLDAHTRVEETNRLLALALPLDGGAYDTLGGLLLHRLGRVPRAGDRLALPGVSITVLEADERRVKRVRLDAADAGHDAAPG
jgi:CBS domain containing-hemolysin-like protein